MLKLTFAKPGQRFNFFLDAEGGVSDVPTDKTVAIDVIAVSHDGNKVLLGWPKNATKQPPAGFQTRNGTTSDVYNYASNEKLYGWGKNMLRTAVVASRILKEGEFDGMTCKKCGESYQYAEPNQADGTLICYSCRSRW